jgi:hypothetical protein
MCNGPARLYLLVVRSSHVELPHLQRGLVLAEPLALKPSGRNVRPILKDRRQARGECHQHLAVGWVRKCLR